MSDITPIASGKYTAADLAAALTQFGLPDAAEQAAFYDLQMAMHRLRRNVDSLRQLHEYDAADVLATVTETSRHLVENVVGRARHLQGLRDPLPEIGRTAIADADEALWEFTFACLPMRVAQ